MPLHQQEKNGKKLVTNFDTSRHSSVLEQAWHFPTMHSSILSSQENFENNPWTDRDSQYSGYNFLF